VDDSSIGFEDRTVAGTVPGAVGVVLGDGAALVRAACRDGMKTAVVVPPHRELLVTPFDDTTCTMCDLRYIIDERLRVAALVKILGRWPGGLVKLDPQVCAGRNFRCDQQARRRPIADALAIEAGDHVKARRPVCIGLANIGHAIRRVVILVEPASYHVVHGQMNAGSGLKVLEPADHIPALPRVEARSQGDDQWPVGVALDADGVGRVVNANEHAINRLRGVGAEGHGHMAAGLGTAGVAHGLLTVMLVAITT
jgi:hypothetical protein